MRNSTAHAPPETIPTATIPAIALPPREAPPLDWALAYAARGWLVFPVHWITEAGGCSCGNPACVDPGKHPLTEHGVLDATTDAAQLEAWWGGWPRANVAAQTGPESGFFALDVDPRHDGDATLTRLERRHGPLPATVAARTGGDGDHLLYRYPGFKVSNATGSAERPGPLGPGIDVRGWHGYLILAPSNHHSGGHYAWELSGHPDETAIAEAPAWLLERLRAAGGATVAPDTPPVDVAAVLNGVGEGERDTELFRTACKLRRLNVPREVAEELILKAAARCRPPFAADKARQKVASAWKYDPEPDDDLATAVGPARTNGHATTPPPAPAPEAEEEEPASVAPGVDGFALTDLGNAERLLAASGHHLRYCETWSKWLVWGGTRWVLDGDERRVRALGRRVVRRMSREAQRRTDADKKGALKLFRWALKSEWTARGGALVTQAETFPRVWLRYEQLDADPYLLNSRNGTVDLHTGRLRPHAPADLLTKLTGAAYAPDARSRRWERFVAEITATADGQPDPEMADYLQRAIGHSLTGDQSEQVVYFPHGQGANGKSTFLNAVRLALGEYAMQAGPDLLMVKDRPNHPTELTDLFRMRLVVSTELEDGRRLAEALVKQMTGGEPIRARRMREDLWEFEPTHTVWIAANHKPVIRGTDHAMWRRIRLVPFDVTFYDRAEDAPAGLAHRVKDPGLPRTLAAELPAILAWAVRGCVAWAREGLVVPKRVRDATDGYRQEMDVLATFLEECCVLNPQAHARATELYEAYKGWCEGAGERPESQTRFGLRLAERGHAKERDTSGQTVRLGLGLRAQPAQPATPPRGAP